MQELTEIKKITVHLLLICFMSMWYHVFSMFLCLLIKQLKALRARALPNSGGGCDIQGIFRVLITFFHMRAPSDVLHQITRTLGYNVVM